MPRPRAEEHSQITRVGLPFYLKILHGNSALRQWAAEHVPFKRIVGPNEAAAVLFLASPASSNRRLGARRRRRPYADLTHDRDMPPTPVAHR